MFEDIKDKLINIFTSRFFVLTAVIICLFGAITYRLFVLQIIKGESYLDNFTLKIERSKTIASTRGTIYDRNGNILATDKLAYSVTIEDNYDTDDNYNMRLNNTIYNLIKKAKQGKFEVSDLEKAKEEIEKLKEEIERNSK